MDISGIIWHYIELKELAFERGKELLIARGEGKPLRKSFVDFSHQGATVAFQYVQNPKCRRVVVFLGIDQLAMGKKEWDSSLVKSKQTRARKGSRRTRFI